jgi:hypothetical protein
MCIFSQTVKHVSKTRVFARVVGVRQYMAYEMRLASDADVAMILPLPIGPAGQAQVAFIDLSEYPEFFDDLDRCFPKPVTRSLDLSAVAAAGSSLPVHRVGAFDASFVPAPSAFTRLDPRFRLPGTVWRDLPYSDFGFAVFQLRAGDARVHPMALWFDTREPNMVFFPTAHVHDGAVHATAPFDHSLFSQGVLDSVDWAHGSVLPRNVMDFGNFLIADRTKGIVEPNTLVVRRELQGQFPNEDTWLPVKTGAA